MATTNERDVVGNVLTSTYLPPIRIHVDPAFQYLGTLQFVLYDVARVEVFVFVVADRQHVTRMVLIDFEGYLEDTPYTYDYPPTTTVNLGGQEYLADAWLVTDELLAQQRQDSDLVQIVTFIQHHGYTLPHAAMLQRFVRVVDAAKRHEVLIFYLEEVASRALTTAERTADGPVLPHHEHIMQEVRERAMTSFMIARV